MKRERKWGITLTVAGVLTTPLGIGIPLLAIGILLLAKEDRINAEPWIRVLFWIVLAGLALAVALVLAFPIEEARSAESGIARSILCFAPAFLAILVSLAMAALTAARFPSLSPKYRILGLGFGVLCVSGACIALVLAFPWQAVAMVGLSVAVWICMAWRKKKRDRRAEALRMPPVEVVVPASPLPRLEPPAPVAKPPKSPRVRRPVCGIWAWGLPLLAVPAGFLLGFVFDKLTHPDGFDAWGIVAIAVLPLVLAVPISIILAIVSLCRRERYPGLAVALLVLYAVTLAFWMFEGLALLVLLIVGVVLSAAWLVRSIPQKTNRPHLTGTSMKLLVIADDDAFTRTPTRERADVLDFLRRHGRPGHFARGTGGAVFLHLCCQRQSRRCWSFSHSRR